MLLRLCLSWRKRLVRARLRRIAPIVEWLEGRVLPSITLNIREFHNSSHIPAGLKASAIGILPQDNGSQFPVGYFPSDLQTAYGLDHVMFGSVAGDGSGQTIAIVDAYDDPSFVDSTASGFANSDLAQFDVNVGIPDPPSFTKVNESGQAAPLPGTDPSGAGNASGNWEIEEALDIEYAHGLAPGANIVLVEASSSSDSDLYTAVTTAASLTGVSAVSMSWGENEFSGETSRDSTFVTPAGHQGVTFLAASGDAGGFSVDNNGNATTTPGIDYPAASPNVVAVGGTSLQINVNDSSYISETAWSGSGGGTSLYENEPAYQKGAQQTGFRTTPDVSFDADPYTGVAIYDSYNNTDNSGPWVQIGGTSLAAPAWAAVVAIVNQGRVLAGGVTLDGSSQTLPALYAISQTDYHDITSGSNGVFSAGPGYDEATGLGTPQAVPLTTDMVRYGGATQIAITSQPPGSVILGDSFGVVVAAENSAGAIDPAFTGALTIALSANPSGATLGGTLTVTASDGIAVFDGLTLDQLGTGYTLQITSSKFASITTNAFDVISNPTPWQDTFYPVPTDASLRAAVNAADSNDFGFNLILLSASTYALSDTSGGALVIDNSSALSSKTLTIAGQGQTSSIIGSAFNWRDRIFNIEGSAGQTLNVAMQGLTIQGGDAQNGGILGGNDGLGGGLLIDEADVMLSNVALQNNYAQGVAGARGVAGVVGAGGGAGGDGMNAKGGGIYLAGGTVSLFNDTFRGNAARGGAGGTGGVGGGQGTKSAPPVTAGAGGAGGQGGSAAGGGIYAAGGAVLLNNDTFLSNQAVGGAGGTGGTGGTGGHGKTGVPGEPGGTGGAGGQGGVSYGGAIYLAGGALTLTQADLQKNTALGGAGGQGGAGGPGFEAANTTAIFGGSGSSLNLSKISFFAPVGGRGGNGGAGGTAGAASAGGIYAAAGTLTLVNTAVADNQALGGQGGAGGRGGTAGFGSAVTPVFQLPLGKTGGVGGMGGQAAPGAGGGILLAGGTVTLYADTLSANLAQGGKGGAGGTGGNGPLAALGSGSFGITTQPGGGSSSLTKTGTGSELNTAGAGGDGGNGDTGNGGGLYVSSGALTLTNSTIADNSAGPGAGGSAGAGGKAGTGKLTGGQGTGGAAGDSYGGGLYVSGGTLNLNNSTIALNGQSGNGAGGGAVVDTTGKVTAVSVLFGGNGAVDYSGSVTATDSLFQRTPVNGTLSGSGNVVNSDPLLDTKGLRNNGGPTQTIALQTTSPAIGAGANGQDLFTDQRGYSPRTGSGGTDIGAYQTDAQPDTQAPTATLQANDVTDANTVPYTFTITYSDNVAMAAATLINGVVLVLPPGLEAPLSASVTNVAAVGTADGVGNAPSFVVTYAITPTGGAWTSADDGDYTVVLGGGAITDLAGNAVAPGALGTFSVGVGSPVVPTAGISGPSDGVAYQPRTFTFTASGSAGDNAAGYAYNIDWGDGVTQTVSPSANNTTITETHAYTTTGTFTPSVTVTNQSNVTSSTVSQTVSIALVEVQSDSDSQGGITGLAISGAGYIALTSTGAANTLQVTRGGKAVGSFVATNGNVAVYGDGGADQVTINGVANSANAFTLTGNSATFTALSLNPTVFTIALDDITTAMFLGGTAGNSFTNTNPTVASVLRAPSGGANAFTFAGSSMGAPTTINGGGANNTLYAPTLSSNQANVWTISGGNSGNLNGSSWTFSDMQNLVGGSNDDDFQFSGVGSISGTIDGGGSYSAAGNTLDYSAYTGAPKVNVNMAHTTATALGGTWANIQTVIGQTSLSAADTLVGPNSTSSWTVAAANSGTVNSLAFSGFGNLTGGSAADTFTVGSAGSLSGLLNGGGGSNTLVGPNVASTFNVTKSNTGNLDGGVVGFTNIQNLTGGTQPNSFIFSNGAGMGGNLTGGAAGDTLDLSARTTSVVANLQTGKVNGIGGIVSNLAAIIGGSAANTLTGPNTSNTWDITAANAGTLNSTFAFTAFGTLLGGTAGNDFVFSDAATLAGKLDGGAGGGTLDMSAYTSNVSLNLATNHASVLTGIATNLVAALGGSGTNTLTGPNLTSTWTITSANSGTLNAFTFTNFDNLIGGTSPDAFTFGSAGSLNGTIDGGAGNNTLTGPNASNTFNVTGSNSGNISGILPGFVHIQNLVGGTGVDVFTFTSAGTVVSINGGGAPANQGDWLDYSSFTTPVVVNLTTGAATNVNGGAAGAVSNIQNVHGGNGGNTLTGNSQGNILIGGSGSNVIHGGSGRSLLIADAGPSTISGGSDGSAGGGDILVGGTTSYDTMTAANEAALMSLLAEWQSGDSYDTRFTDIDNGSGGLNGTNSLNYGTTVMDNGQANTLSAQAGTAAVDWFFANQAAGHTVIQTSESGEHMNNT